MEPTSQNRTAVEIMMEDAAIKDLEAEEQVKLKEILEANQLGLNVAMTATLKEIMEGKVSK